MKRLSCKAFLAASIRAKTQTETRLLIAIPEWFEGHLLHAKNCDSLASRDGSKQLSPRYLPGEIIGIAEPWCVADCFDNLSGDEINAVHPDFCRDEVWMMADGEKPPNYGRQRLARFLPDAFVRTRVRILSVGAERLQDIDAEAVDREGLPEGKWSHVDSERVGEFRDLWDSIHPEAPFASSPWVWVYRFELAP